MSPLTRTALELLEDATASPGVKAVACATILAALENGIEVASGSQLAVWRHVLLSDGGAVTLHRHELIHVDVARDAVRVLLDGDAGESAHDLAVAVLKGSNVRVISDEDLATIADRMMDEGKVRRFAWLTERVYEERGLNPVFIAALRDRLAGSSDPSVRAGAVEVGGLAPRFDERFAIRMLKDASPVVRTAVADMLEKVDAVDRPSALALVRTQLDVEQHRSVISALHYALGSLVRASGRRVRLGTGGGV